MKKKKAKQELEEKWKNPPNNEDPMGSPRQKVKHEKSQ